MADHSLTDAAHDLIPKLRDFARHPDTTPELRVQVNVLAERLEALISAPVPPQWRITPTYCQTCGAVGDHWPSCPEAS
jgi:hypothetical protein